MHTMRITQEADNAIRIIYCLAKHQKKLGAKEIAEKTSVTLRFTLKILRKLIGAEFIKSFKGMKGGYILKKLPAEISVGDVVEAIDGPISIVKCLNGGCEEPCPTERKTCPLFRYALEVNDNIRNMMYSKTFLALLEHDKSECSYNFNQSRNYSAPRIIHF